MDERIGRLGNLKSIKTMMVIQFDSVGLEEMSHEETQEFNGGILPWVAGALVALAISAINNFGDIREGFSDGNSGQPPRH